MVQGTFVAGGRVRGAGQGMQAAEKYPEYVVRTVRAGAVQGAAKRVRKTVQVGVVG